MKKRQEPTARSGSEKEIADEAKALTKLQLLELMQHYQWGDDANLRLMPAEEWFRLTELLLAAWKQGRIHKLFAAEADALKLITRVAEHNWFFKRQDAAKLPVGDEKRRLLFLSLFDPHPMPRHMSQAMNKSLSARDYSFFEQLAAQLKRKPVVASQLQTVGTTHGRLVGLRRLFESVRVPARLGLGGTPHRALHSERNAD